MINYIFGFFIVLGVIYSLFNGNIDNVNNSLLMAGSDAVSMVIKMIPVMCLWLGLMKIATSSGLLDKITKYTKYIIRPLFPELKSNSKSISYITSNIVMNMFGLGNAATPFGLKAMESMQEENTNKKVASRSMITFLVVNTASVTIIPTTVISLRLLYNSNDPTKIVFPAIITTIISLIVALILDRIFYYIWGKYD